MTRIAIDPVTRIEGHLRIEVEVEGGTVRDAWSSGTMFRGLELILRGRDPRDAWVFAQRACGVCTTVHALASVRAVENALGITVPPNARRVRNIMAAVQMVHDHVVHFYHLHALDWVDVVSATTADPARAAALARSTSDWPGSVEHFTSIRDRIKRFVGSGQLGPFANGYWGHPAYLLPPEANLLLVAHYLEALDWQRDIVRAHAILGGKNPHPQSYVVGGMALRMAPNAPTGLNTATAAQLGEIAQRARAFVAGVLLPDVELLARSYPDWARLGRGLGNYLTYGDYPEGDGDDRRPYFPGGRVLNRDLGRVLPVDQGQVREHVARSWYEGEAARHPFEGETVPRYEGPQPPVETLAASHRYSWLKAPRYDGGAVEVGPLARIAVAYASGHADVVPAVDALLGRLGLGREALFSTMGRIAARAVETGLLADRLVAWAADLAAAVAGNDLTVADSTRWEPDTWPADAKGWGAVEAPRGSLGHWIVIRDGRVANYQLIVPTTWNGSPRDAAGRRGAWEEALVGTPVADPRRPVEVLRTLHSFDPCMACAVHVHDPSAGTGVEVSVI